MYINGHVGFTGTQRGMNAAQRAEVRRLLESLRKDGYTHFHHGDCIGADLQAHDIARDLGFCVVLHPPVNDSKRAFCDSDVSLDPLPYLTRNHAIVDSSATMIATPGEKTEQLRSGTWATIRYSQKKKKALLIVRPE